MVKFDCAWCDKEFERSPRLVRDKAKGSKAGPFCSRSCAGKYSRQLQLKLIDKFKPQKPVKSEYYKRKYASIVLSNQLFHDLFINYYCLILDED